MSGGDQVGEPTFETAVAEQLDALASEVSTAGRFLDACDTIKDFRSSLARDPKEAHRRYNFEQVEQSGAIYFVFVITSPAVFCRTFDTFCVIYRPEDGRLHIYSYANCNSMKEYEKKRAEMHAEVQSLQNLEKLLA